MSGYVYIFIVLVIIGVALLLINKIVPMEPWVKTVINAVAAVGVMIWLLQVFGLISGHYFRLPR